MPEITIEYELTEMALAHIKNPKTKGHLLKGDRLIKLRNISQSDMAFLYAGGKSKYVKVKTAPKVFPKPGK